jgi:exosortase J
MGISACLALARLQHGNLVYGRSGGNVILLPLGLLLWGYVSGMVVLLGGGEAWRRAALPLALILFVNPVPGFFQFFIDLPLQHAGARAAWIFASWLGTPVSGKPGDLWLYFAPGFGMFVAPACNGLRSAVTMGYLALVVGHLSRLSRPRLITYVTAALLLAFVLNAVRLCILVLLNRVALTVPFLYKAIEQEQSWIDYVMYIPLFFVAAWVLFRFARRLRVE